MANYGFQWEKSFQNMNGSDMIHLFDRIVKKITWFYSA